MNMETWTWRHGHGVMDIETWNFKKIKWKTEAHAIFLNSFNVCSLSKRKFVVFPFVDEETNGSYPLQMN
jgi:hypothetical protein